MSYVSPALREKFESMPIAFQDEILSRDVRIENLCDLISVLEAIAAEGAEDVPTA